MEMWIRKINTISKQFLDSCLTIWGIRILSIVFHDLSCTFAQNDAFRFKWRWLIGWLSYYILESIKTVMAMLYVTNIVLDWSNHYNADERIDMRTLNRVSLQLIFEQKLVVSIMSNIKRTTLLFQCTAILQLIPVIANGLHERSFLSQINKSKSSGDSRFLQYLAKAQKI